MRYDANTVHEYMDMLPPERKPAMLKLWDTIRKNILKGFTEDMGYNMPGMVVPHSIYPSGYHCDPKQALPFLSIASQKNFIALYHMGIYVNPNLLKWFTTEFPKHSKAKLDMGKSCIRFKKIDQIPYDLIAELVKKISVQDWINTYEKEIKR